MLDLLLYKRVVKLIQDDISPENLSKNELQNLFVDMNAVGEKLDTDTITDIKLDYAMKLVQKYGDLSLILKISNFIDDLRKRRDSDELGIGLKSDLWLTILSAKGLYEHVLKISSLKMMPLILLAYHDHLKGSFDETVFLEKLARPIDLPESEEYDQLSLYEDTTKPEHFSTVILSTRTEMENFFKNTIPDLDKLWKFNEFLKDLINMLSAYGNDTYRGAIKVITYLADKVKSKNPKGNNKPSNQLVILPIANR